MKKIKVDIGPMIGKVYDEWNGEGIFKQYLRRKENTKRFGDFIIKTANLISGRFGMADTKYEGRFINGL